MNYSAELVGYNDVMSWNAIQFVSSGVTLVAFLAATILALYTRKMLSRERLIESAPESSRALLVQTTLKSFGVDTSQFTKVQAYDLALQQIRALKERYRLNCIVISFVCTLAFIVFLVALLAAQPVIGVIGVEKQPAKSNLENAQLAPAANPAATLPEVKKPHQDIVQDSSQRNASTDSHQPPAIVNDLIKNGGFEQPSLEFSGKTPTPEWFASDARNNITNGLSLIKTPGRGQFLELISGINDSTAVFQNVPTEIGKRYNLTFDFAAGDGGTDVDCIQVGIGGDPKFLPCSIMKQKFQTEKFSHLARATGEELSIRTQTSKRRIFIDNIRLVEDKLGN